MRSDQIDRGSKRARFNGARLCNQPFVASKKGVAMRKLKTLALGLAAVAALTVSAAAADQTRVVFVTHGQSGDPYWSVVKNGMDDAAKALGVKAEYVAPETFDMAKMAQMIDAAVASKPDGLVLSIPDASALGGPMKNAVAAGIPVIVIDSGGPKLTKELGGLLYLGQSEYDAGVLAGERVAKLGMKKPACLNHEVGNQSLDDRCAGFSKGFGAEVPVVQGVMDPTEMKGRVLAWMNAHADTDFLLGNGINSAEPALAALEELGLVGKVKLGTFDLSPGILKAVSEGKMEWGIDAQQYLMGYIPVVQFDLMKKYKLMPVADYPTGPGFVTKDAAAPVIEFAKMGKR